MLRVLRQGMRGDDVRKWQYFLIGQGFNPGPADGTYTEQTSIATGDFQIKCSISPNGAVTNSTWALALSLGLGVAADVSRDEDGPNWPPQPGFASPSTSGARADIFGRFTFTPSPVPSNPEAIKLSDGWYAKNIVQIAIPQFDKLQGFPHSIPFHRLAVNQLLSLWRAWEAEGLLGEILTWDGSYSARFMRGSRSVLSSHAFGSSFDINAQWNALGAQPALTGQKGSVRKLVVIANDYGFYWGGHNDNRPDGMHFELAYLTKSQSEQNATECKRLNLFKLYSISKRAIEEDPDLVMQGVNLVMDELQAMIDGNYLTDIDEVFKEINVNMVNADILAAMLAATKNHPELKERPAFFDRISARIHEIDSDRADKVLDPLK
jgi:hypothetical protein